mmetsp:Transcript_20806/g.45840  ORF Transcript_20806/g.45840 Transcript_20806/m.45840 type:complete len:231 (+) Transcript_20806:1330-2022(+)
MGTRPAICSASTLAAESAPPGRSFMALPRDPTACRASTALAKAEAPRSCAPAGGAAKRSEACPRPRRPLMALEAAPIRRAVAEPDPSSKDSVRTSPEAPLTSGTSARKLGARATSRAPPIVAMVPASRPKSVATSTALPRACSNPNAASTGAGLAAAPAALSVACHGDFDSLLAKEGLRLTAVPSATNAKPMPRCNCNRAAAQPRPVATPSATAMAGKGRLAQGLRGRSP